MFTLAVDIFESIYTRFTFLSFKSKRVNFNTSFITPCYLSIAFDFVRFIILDAYRLIYMTCENHMISLPTILVLKNSRIYIHLLNNYNVMSNVETSIDEFFSFGSILRVLNVHPYNCYVQFWKSFNNLRVRS